MRTSLGKGFLSLGRNRGLVLLVLLANLAFGLVLAVPLAMELEGDLVHRGASNRMMSGFDFDWWAQWSSEPRGASSALSPEILGTGFAYRNLDLLLKGFLPVGLFAGGARAAVPPAILGVGALYLLLQVFLTGGLLGVFRAPQGGWTVRGLAHGSGFYFGRILRVSLLALAAAGVVFAIDAPFARWVDGFAREAVSERTAVALTLGRNGILLLALVLVHMVSSHAKVLVVREERLSAGLAFLSSLGFCARNLIAALGQYAVVLALGAVLLALFGALDARLAVVGWRSQAVALILLEATVAACIALRLGLLASQMELQRAQGR
ncbi:MAG TPA: hypothetical protein VL691_24650 [Vicinamibacteria bacterium]|nr:hypothetical protein [Vicinamibacteria bacterium]